MRRGSQILPDVPTTHSVRATRELEELAPSNQKLRKAIGSEGSFNRSDTNVGLAEQKGCKKKNGKQDDLSQLFYINELTGRP